MKNMASKIWQKYFTTSVQLKKCLTVKTGSASNEQNIKAESSLKSGPLRSPFNRLFSSFQSM